MTTVTLANNNRRPSFRPNRYYVYVTDWTDGRSFEVQGFEDLIEAGATAANLAEKYGDCEIDDKVNR